MQRGRLRGALSLPKVITVIIAGTIILSLLFFAFWKRFETKVEAILKDQFNQQQLMLAKKIADNAGAYFDFLESELLAYPWRFRLIPPGSPGFNTYMAARFRDLQPLGILAIRWYDRDGQLRRAWGRPESAGPPSPADRLPPKRAAWVNNPKNKGRLYLGKVQRAAAPPWQGRLVMPLLTGLYASPADAAPDGALELLINPLYIAGKITAGVRSGETGYPWIIDQNGTILAHYEKDFVSQDAIKIRQARNPKISFHSLQELQNRILKGEEGTDGYISGWHRQRLGEIPKLAAYTPIRFSAGLIRGLTDVEDPDHNFWGVAVVAPIAEVAGNIEVVMHQELFLVALFILSVLIATVALIGVALSWNKVLTREVEHKTKELLESQERLVRSERFAAIGEAAAYVSHEIKNPLMVIGGLAHQVERKVEDLPSLTEKLRIIQGEVHRLESFLGDLRDFTRPAPPAKQEININQVIQDVDHLMEVETKKKGVALVEKLDPRLPPVQADPDQMKQVLLNLVKNSLEALDSGGQLILTSGSEDNQVWFSIQDTGGGMSPEVLEKIFNPFFTTKAQGTGLGLAVIHKIITDHHGTITVKSTPDQGTTFRVILPSAS